MNRDEDRTGIAAVAMAALIRALKEEETTTRLIMDADYVAPRIAKAAIFYADALITELDKPKQKE